MTELKPDTHLNTDLLIQAGLNIHAILDLKDLPGETIAQFNQQGLDLSAYSQLLLIGHKGRQLWEKVAHEIGKKNDPIDEYTLSTIHALFSNDYPDLIYQIIYPGDHVINLQQLGRYAGWHNTTPFRIGIHPEWGSWFAYRAAILANSSFKAQAIEAVTPSPCDQCATKPCIAACPADACKGHPADLDKCLGFRQQKDSPCAYTCLAREACPVGKHSQYSDEQMHYHYSISLKHL